MADIFLSYAPEDRDRVQPLVEALEGEGWMKEAPVISFMAFKGAGYGSLGSIAPVRRTRAAMSLVLRIAAIQQRCCPRFL